MARYAHFTADGIPFNPASSLLDIDYVLTTQDGTTFNIEGDDGELRDIRDRNGNTLRITEAGITSRRADGVIITNIPFTRDYLGRIVAITDPAGHSIKYEYDANGDLVSVKDRNAVAGDCGCGGSGSGSGYVQKLWPGMIRRPSL